jgi:hypothetical protein
MARLFLSPWLTFRQAREALKSGQPDEARQLLAPYAQEGYKKAIALMGDVAVAYIDRAEKALRADKVSQAWADLQSAEGLNLTDGRAAQLRATLTHDGLNEVRASLEAMNPIHAVRVIVRLKDCNVRTPELTQLEEAAQAWLHASEQANRGDFTAAKSSLDVVRRRIEGLHAEGVEKYGQELERREVLFAKAVPSMYAAANDKSWKRVVTEADAILVVAPDHKEVRVMRANAWQALQPGSRETPAVVLEAAVGGAMGAVAALDKQPTEAYTGERPVITTRPGSTAEIFLPAGAPLPRQLLLWVDGVGGYLVCLRSSITIGQATADTLPDIPLFAPIGGLHATISRDADGGYILESGRETSINGTATQKSVLRPGDRVTLGNSCQFLFHRPSATSNTTRLEIVSGHRLPWAVDGVILMDQTLILGTCEQVHIPLPVPYEDDPDIVVETVKLILHRAKEGLALKCGGKFRVDSRPCEGKAELPLPANIQTDRYTFTIEPVGPRL